MNCEVAVVGGGIGGLTVAALLARRGVDVCLFERESVVGGCAASFEKFGYRFEQGYGLFTGWEPDDIHARIFTELGVAPPEVRPLDPSYEVRLPDGNSIKVGANNDEFEADLARVFPECADGAVGFYRKVNEVGNSLRRTLRRSPELLSNSKTSRTFALLREGKIASEILSSANDSTAKHLQSLSPRFRRFVDLQLQTFAQGTSENVAYLRAAIILSAAHGGMFEIAGGGAALAERLASASSNNGGRVRLNSPVLRLSYSSSGTPVGIDLLNGENVRASRAIVSNLTIWDTYGKLVGLNRTPSEIRKELNSLRGWGAYLLFLGLEANVAETLPASHVLSLTDWQEDEDYDPETGQLVFASPSAGDDSAPQGKRAVTFHSFTDVDNWFTFHHDESELEAADQKMMEICWERLHRAMPELGSAVEVIDTATPRSFYDSTRRKLGMVGSVIPSPGSFWQDRPTHQTAFPNLFIVSDTTSAPSLSEVSGAALLLANDLTNQ